MIRLAVIGTGSMAHAQTKHFSGAGGAELVACCDVDQKRAERFAGQYGFAKAYGDAGKMLASEKLDAVSIVTPNGSHCELSVAALKKRMHVMCEKPMAMNGAEAWRMLRAARKAGTVTMINFSYRQSSALEKARELVAAGELGKLRHVEASYLQGWLCGGKQAPWRTNQGLQWRLDRSAGGSGTLGDLGCHILDFSTRVAGDITDLSCRLARFDKGVPGERLGGYRFDADDSVFVTARFTSGAMGTIHTTRWAPGQQNSIRLRVYGDEGALEIDLDRSYEVVKVCLGRVARNHAAWSELKLPPRENNMSRFLRAVREGRAESPTFEDGLRIQAYLDACIESDRTGRPVAIKPLVS